MDTTQPKKAERSTRKPVRTTDCSTPKSFLSYEMSQTPPKPKRISISPIQPTNALSLPNPQSLSSDPWQASLAALNLTDKALGFHEDSKFGKNLEKIYKFLETVLNNDADGLSGCNSSLYICGGPGTGKTSGVLLCCRRMIEAVRKRDDDLKEPILCHITASHISTSITPMSHIMQEIAGSLNMKSSSPTASGIKQKLRKGNKLLFLVLDEIDLMISGSFQSEEGRMTITETAIRNILEWVHDESFPVAFIGISNTVGNDKYARLQGIGEVSDFY